MPKTVMIMAQINQIKANKNRMKKGIDDERSMEIMRGVENL